MRRRVAVLRRFFACTAFLVSIASEGSGQSTDQAERLTLSQAIDLALQNNHRLRIAAEKVNEMRSAKRVTASDYLPKLSNSTSFEHLTQHNVVQFAAGSFGTFPGLGRVPENQLIVNQGELNQVFSRTQLAQPLTQLFKIRDANRVAQADVETSRNDLRRLQLQIALAVRQLYYGLLIAKANQKAAASLTRAAERELAESQEDISKGSALEVALIQAKAALIEDQQQELQAGIQNSDLQAEINDALGLPISTVLELDETPETPQPIPAKDQCLQLAQSAEPEIHAAEDAVRKAQSGVAAARAEYIPDLTAFARHDYQNGVPFLFHNYNVFGLNFSYEIFEGGKRHALVKQHQAQLAQAEENLRRLKDEAAVNVEKSLDKLKQTKHMVEVAEQLVALREEANRLSTVQLSYGALVESKRLSAAAAVFQARAELLKAELTYSLSRAELEVIIGDLPR